MINSSAQLEKKNIKYWMKIAYCYHLYILIFVAAELRVTVHVPTVSIIITLF